jgi:HEPN domain-containing protein
MTQEEHINYWLESAQHDLETAESLFNSTKYDWSLFVAHLVLEKTIKSIFVKNNQNKIPPKIHNLVRLSELSLLDLNEEQRIFLDEVNDFNLEVRYPEYKKEFYKFCSKEVAEKYLYQIKELLKWLKSQLK